MRMLRIRQSIHLVLTNALSASFLIVHITFDEISTTLYNSGNGRCTQNMWSNDKFVLLLFFMKIENIAYTSFQKEHALVH